jgi:hypothetical protein
MRNERTDLSHGPVGRSPWWWSRAAPLVATASLALGACGSGGDDATATSTAPTVTSLPTTVTAATSSPTTVTTSSPVPGDEAAAIEAAFQEFFDGLVDVDRKVSLLQDGERYRSMLVDAAGDPIARTLSTRVESVTPLDEASCVAAAGAPRCARVVHDLLTGGLPALVGHEGYAVLEGDRWLVASTSWCDVVVIGGAECPSA